MEKCKGCGIEIQTTEKDKPGYLPETVLIERQMNNETVLCQRCYKIKHYNELLPIEVDSDFYDQLDNVVKDFNNIIWVIDAIDFEGTFRKDIADKLEGKNVILAVNKADLLPKFYPYAEYKDWLYDRTKKLYKFKRDNIRIISAADDFGIRRMMKMIQETGEKKVLIIGVTNVGKSSILNKITRKQDITVSSYPGTTLKMQKRHAEEFDLEIYDTPGIEPKDRVCDLFDIYTQVKMIPSKEISRKTFKLEVGRVLCISALFNLKVLAKDRYGYDPVFIVYAPQNVSFHETNENRVEDLKDNRDILNPPYDDSFNVHEIKTLKQKYKIDEGYDLVIPGLTWLAVRRGPLEIEVEVPENIKPVIRKSLISPKITDTKGRGRSREKKHGI